MIERTVYQCEHCKKYKWHPKFYFSHSKMQKHEGTCLYNPETKSCFTCMYNNMDGGKRGNFCGLCLKPEMEPSVRTPDTDFLTGEPNGHVYFCFPNGEQPRSMLESVKAGCEHWEDHCGRWPKDE